MNKFFVHVNEVEKRPCKCLNLTFDDTRQIVVYRNKFKLVLVQTLLIDRGEFEVGEILSFLHRGEDERKAFITSYAFVMMSVGKY